MKNFNFFGNNSTAQEKKTKYDKNDSANAFLGGLLAPIIISFIFVFIFVTIALMAQSEYETILNHPVVQVITLLLSQIAFGIFLWWYNKKKNVDFPKAIKFKKVNIILVILSVVVAVAFLFLSNNFINLLDYLLRLTGYDKSSSLPLELNNVGQLLLGITILAVVPAFLEEMLFRGMVVSGLVDKKSTLKKKILAVFISALIFACIHQSAQQFLFPLISGMVFGLVYLFSGNIWYSIIMHFSSNATVVIMSYISSGSDVVSQPIVYDFGTVALSIGLFIAAIAIVIGFIFLIKKLTKENEFFDTYENEEVEIVVDEKIESKNDNIDNQNEVTKVLPKSSIMDTLARNKFLIAFALSIFMIVYDLISYIS